MHIQKDRATMTLTLDPNIPDADGFYEKLIDTHRGLTEEQSRDVNCKLVLLLANHVGDMAVLEQAMALAREGYGDDV